MKCYYYKGKKISEEEFSKLSDDEKKLVKPWKINNKSKDKRSGTKPNFKRQDGKWYEITEQLTRDVGSIPYNVFAGTKETITGTLAFNASNRSVPAVGLQSTPGFIVLHHLNTYGKSSSATSAINIAARAVYSWVRHQNSGHTNYEAPDLMIYIMAVDQVYAAIGEAMRIYKTAKTFINVNRYFTDAALRAMEVDADDIYSNLAQLRAGINLRVAKISSLCVPNRFEIFKRHMFTAEGIFTDSDSLRGQFYLYSTMGYLQFSSTAETTGGSLQFYDKNVSSTSGLRSTATILQDIDNLLNAILEDEDMNIMSGDILKAYGQENLYILNELAEDATQEFIFNEDVLQQIENSSCWEGGFNAQLMSLDDYKIMQAGTGSTSDGFLITHEIEPDDESVSTDNLFVHMNSLYFNSHKENPQPIDTLEWVRDMCAGGSYDTELLLEYAVVQYDYSTNTNGVISLQVFVSASATVTNNLLFKVAQFDWHPILYLFTKLNNPTSGPYFGYVDKAGDLKVYTILSSDTIERLHDTCIMGSMGKLALRDVKAK